MNPSTQHRSPRLAASRAAGWLAGTVVLAWLLVSLWRASFPSPPARLTFEVTFPRGIAGRCEPLLTTGFPGDGDFLAVRYTDEKTAVLIYDVWGMGGPVSRPLALKAGERRVLDVAMPTLESVANFKSHEKRPLRVALDGEVLLDESVYFHRRRPAEIFFATNPIGGNLVRESFRGRLALTDGRTLRGGPECLFAAAERLRWIVRAQPGAIAGRLLASVLIGFAVAWLFLRCAQVRWRELGSVPARPTIFASRTAPPHGWFFLTALGCTLAFATVITGGTFRLIHPETFGHFYDYQALSLLQGRLDLPEPAHSSESFIFEGRHYIYFGPTPALLRLPFVVFKIAFGELSRSFMLAYYVAFLAAVYALLVHVNRLATGTRSWPTAARVVGYVAIAGLGTTIFFLSSRAYIYHEAILCGAMFATWSGYCSLRYLATPLSRWWVGALLCGIAAVQARPTTGLFAIGMLGATALVVALRRGASSGSPRRHILIAGAAGAGMLSFNAVSYLKFKTFDGCPLRYHAQYNPERLAAMGGGNFHVSNLAFGVDTYLWRSRPGIRDSFPYIFVWAGNPQNYPTAKIDLADPTLSMPYTMPAIFLLGLAGAVCAVFAWPGARLPLAIVVVAAAPMTLLMFTAIAVSERYTADFCPALVLAGGFGLHAVDFLRPRWRTTVLGLLGVLGAWSILVNAAITVHYQGEVVWGVDPAARRNYEQLRACVNKFFGERGGGGSRGT